MPFSAAKMPPFITAIHSRERYSAQSHERSFVVSMPTATISVLGAHQVPWSVQSRNLRRAVTKMAKSKMLQPGWWRAGDLWRRLLCLGALLGAVGGLVFHISYTFGRLRLDQIGFSLFFLLLEMIVMSILGLAAGCAVLIAQRAVPRTAPRGVRTVLIGVGALMVSSALVFALFSLFPPVGETWAVVSVTGVIVGSAFAAVSYSHTSEIWLP